MNFYPHHIGDYKAATSHLSNEEDLAYRRLLEMYYDTERKIPLDTHWVSRRLRLGTDVVISVLKDFFLMTDDGYFHARCESEILKYNEKAEVARRNGKSGGRRKANASAVNNPAGSCQVSDGLAKTTQPLTNQEPVTKNQEPVTRERERAKRLPSDFTLPDSWVSFCQTERPDLDPWKTFDKFRDYWTAKAGKDGAKLDWLATWRNWVREERRQSGIKVSEPEWRTEQRNRTLQAVPNIAERQTQAQQFFEVEAKNVTPLALG